MEQFSPSKSKLFAATAFANLYSSVLIKTARALLATILLALMLISVTGSISNLLYLAVSISIVYSIFEIFYHAKIIKEKPIPLKDTKNLADSFSFETAKLLLKTPSVRFFGETFWGLLASREVLFVLNRCGINQNTLNKLVKDQQASSLQINFDEIVVTAKAWAEKEGRAFIDTLDILLAMISKSPDLQQLLFAQEIKEQDLLNIVFWARSIFEKDPPSFLGKAAGNFWAGDQ